MPEGADRQEHYRRYREDLVRQAGICIVIAGVVQADGMLASADGVLAEYEMMRALDRIPVPVGSTGGAAKEIWTLVERDYQNIYGSMPRKLFDALADRSLDAAGTVQAVESVLAWLSKNEI